MKPENYGHVCRAPGLPGECHIDEAQQVVTVDGRPTEDEVLLDVAEAIARRGTCARLQVGAVLARDGRVLATGRNGAPSGLPHCEHNTHEPCTESVHAEANAVAFAARTGGGAYGATLYLTHAPCLACSGLLINAGIARVVYRRPYRLRDGVKRLEAAGVQVEHHQGENT